MSRTTRLALSWAVVVAVLLGAWAVLRLGDGDRGEPSSAGPSASASVDGLPVVEARSLPPEARRTLQLITARGPFRYHRDGAVFENREGLLPQHRRGYYREYTVPTPGETDRGARRIVEGQEGERYWTEDHYSSFARIRPDEGRGP